ncbi:hybrid signal transduction histidine kinase B-like [Cydia amplana]|uniref:hybrid signal transduction histidine kinase B-like n=1 Tax=Cydia amplana TaxID=1869771 RepID=UPI002FE511D5
MYSKVFAVLAVVASASANDLHEGYNGTASHKPIFQGHYAGDWKTAVRPGMDIFVNTSGLITGINVTDLREGKDGVANIASGGIGHENVTISLKSPNILRGYDFLVEVFADEETSKTNERGNRDVQESVNPEQKPSQTVSTSTTGKPTDQQQQQVTGKPTSQQEHQVSFSTTGKPSDQQQQGTVPAGKPPGQQEDQVTVPTTGRPTGQQKQHQQGTVPTTGKPSQQQHQTGHPITTAVPEEVEIPEEVKQPKIGFQIEEQN